MGAEGPERAPPRSPGRLIALATVAVYVTAAKLGLSLAVAAEQVRRSGRRPASRSRPSSSSVRAGRGPASHWALRRERDRARAIVTAAGIAAGNTLESLTAGWLPQRVASARRYAAPRTRLPS